MRSGTKGEHGCMFDMATRASPNTASLSNAAAPFDLRLLPPTAPQAYPSTAWVTDTGLPEPSMRMLASYAMELEDTLATAVVLSLFTDSRAGADDKLPLHSTDRRGWVGDEYMPGSAELGRQDRWGSLLWLVASGKVLPDVLERARFAAWEALQWLVTDGLASRVQVLAVWAGANQDRLAVRPTIWQGDEAKPVYDVLWATSLRRYGVQAH